MYTTINAYVASRYNDTCSWSHIDAVDQLPATWATMVPLLATLANAADIEIFHDRDVLLYDIDGLEQVFEPLKELYDLAVQEGMDRTTKVQAA